MIALGLPTGHLTVVAVGAHPDDIEIACGGTLLTLASRGALQAHVLVMTGNDQRRAEARSAAGSFLAGADLTHHSHDLPDGRLPAHWDDVKSKLEALAAVVQPDLVLAPRNDDAHQDHRLIGRLVPTVWRDALVLHYEIPKWDGDLRPVTHYLPLTDEVARRKVQLLADVYPSQVGRDWWDPETFFGLMRIRGVECRSRYAEGFVVSKATLRV